MITLHGIPASPGVAIGPAWLYQKVQLAAYEELSRLTAQAEQRRFDCAVQEARAQLDRLYEKTVREAGEAAAQIFDIHKMMMEDLDYLESVEDNITNQLYTAEHAVACAGQEFAEMFASMDDEVMRARSADIRDITQRLLQVLTGGQSQALEESSVVCAHDLFPSDTMQLEREHVMAFPRFALCHSGPHHGNPRCGGRRRTGGGSLRRLRDHRGGRLPGAGDPGRRRADPGGLFGPASGLSPGADGPAGISRPPQPHQGRPGAGDLRQHCLCHGRGQRRGGAR